MHILIIISKTTYFCNVLMFRCLSYTLLKFKLKILEICKRCLEFIAVLLYRCFDLKATIFLCCTKHNFSCKSFLREAITTIYNIQPTQNLELVFLLRWKNFSVPACAYIRTLVYCRNRYTSHKRSFAVYMLSQKVGDFLQRLDFSALSLKSKKSSFIDNVAKTQYKTNRLKVFFYSFTFVILSLEYFSLIGGLGNMVLSTFNIDIVCYTINSSVKPNLCQNIKIDTTQHEKIYKPI